MTRERARSVAYRRRPSGCYVRHQAAKRENFADDRAGGRDGSGRRKVEKLDQERARGAERHSDDSFVVRL